MIVGMLAIGVIVGLLSGGAALLGGSSPLVALAIYSGAGLVAALALVILGLIVAPHQHRGTISADPAVPRQRFPT